MNEAQKMMGGLKDPNKMANIMKNRQQQHGGATRDRLRKKLDNLDNKLLNIIKKRSNLVKNVLELKKFHFAPVQRKMNKFVFFKHLYY